MAGIRLKYVLAIDYTDFTYSIIDFAILGPLEPMLGIISACLPMLPPVIARFSKNKRLLAWSTKGDNSGSGKQSGSKEFRNRAIRTFGSSGPKKNYDHSVLDTTGFDQMDDGDYSLVEYAASGAGETGIMRTTEVNVNSRVASDFSQV